MDQKIANETLAAMIAQHPDLVCDAEALFNRLASAPWLAGLAAFNALDVAEVIRANICFDFQWGVEFKQLYQSPPVTLDWKASYYDRANLFADRLGVLKPFDKPNNRLRVEYGGPF